jgi:glycosyltransferase involved in cell wall biosynthesis
VFLRLFHIAMTNPYIKVMLVTKKLVVSPTGGRELLCKLNHDALSGIFGSRLTLYELAAQPKAGFCGILKAFRGHIDGLTTEVMNEAVASIKSFGIKKVFLDGSNLGAIAYSISKRCPDVEIVAFFHNVEARFFLGSLRQRKTIRALAVLLANFRAERLAVRYSDKRICLSQRDSLLLEKIYGRGATHISPMAMEDKASGVLPSSTSGQYPPMMLFVGGTFYGNQVGIAWFVKHVVPRIDMPVCIVGKGFENYRDALEVPGKVTVVGTVGDLCEWYAKASFVVAPIFDGSGMKTKVAEALMHGKRVIGTPEAFSGYEVIAQEIGWICSSSDEFVSAIKEASNRSLDVCAPELRKIYVDNYSLAAARERIKRIMQ